MVDFHSHILPGMDDGASSPEESLQMLARSRQQGVDVLFATSHFYADEEDPAAFLVRREEACGKLLSCIAEKETLPEIPELFLGAEVYYFPGISTCEEIVPLALENTGLLLVEPPFAPFSRGMLREIESIRSNLGLIPVVAHLDRYCRMLRDYTLFHVLAEREIMVQVNASFFLNPSCQEQAMEMLRLGLFHILGSDCHNLEDRAPNLGPALRKIKEKKLDNCLAKVTELSYNILEKKRIF